MLDFQEEFEKCSGDKSLILGNGFGRSYDDAFHEKCFSWDTLLDSCEIEKVSPLYSLLDECNLDFEVAHQKLNNAIDILLKYSRENKLIQDLKEQVQYLREQLIKSIHKSHPDSFSKKNNYTPIGFQKPEEGVAGKVEKCRTFLQKFSHVFSLNYDLLLYWVRGFENNWIGEDAFGEDLVFDPDKTYPTRTGKTLFLFPHGTLFLLRDGYGAKKIKGYLHQPILSQVEENIKQDIFPMCISEGTGEQKLNVIKSNSYLWYVYKRIEECKGTIFTFGCSLGEKDSHIVEAILKSRCTKVVVGAFGSLEEENLRHQFSVAKQKLGSQIEIVIAYTSKTNLWQS